MKREQNLLSRSCEPMPSAALSPPGFVGDDLRLPPELARLGDRQRMRLYVRLLGLLGDALAIVGAYLIAGIIRFGDPFHDQVLTIIAVVFPVYFAVAANNRSFNLSALTRARSGAAHAVTAYLITLSVVGLVVFFLKVSTDFSRAALGIGAAMALVLLPVSRFTLSRLTKRLFGMTTLNEVIIEDGVKVAAPAGTVVLDVERHGLLPRLNDPVALDWLGRCLHKADRVIVACPPERRRIWALALKGADVNAEVFASELDELGPLGLRTHNGRSTLIVAAGPLGLADRSLKRLLDLALAIASFPITLPLMAAVAIAIRLDSPGPILFAQTRVGLGNRLFKMYKFRSMRAHSLDQSGDRSTGRDDARVTRVGRFIRKTSLDELPQLLNILSGAMSIVGPRPHALGSKAADQFYWDIELNYWHRHAVKPGMTGLAQVRGYRGSTESTSDLTNRLQADLEYLAGWSIWRDIAIILATVRVLTHSNAY